MKIDKSKFSVEELKQYEALIAKAVVPDDDGKLENKPGSTDESPKKDDPELADDIKDNDDAMNKGKNSDCKKSVEETEPAKKSEEAAAEVIAPVLKAMQERLGQLEKRAEMNRYAEIAKKYALLDDDGKLAERLYELGKSDKKSYDACISLLEKSLETVNKSGLFTEIGKTGTGAIGGTVIDKIEAAASDIQKADPSLNRTAAIAKAWENHPELVQEYDAEYSAK